MAEVQMEPEFEADMSAISRVYSFRPGHVLSEDDFRAIQAFDAASRRDLERATEAFHRGYQQGLTEGGSADVAAMKNKLSDLRCEVATEKTLKRLAEADREKLKSAIDRIFKSQVYEDRDMHKGISLDMVEAIREAALAAGLLEPLPTELAAKRQ